MSEKQTIFFTINCAENLKSPNQCDAEFQVQIDKLYSTKNAVKSGHQRH
jgi:hypothetical protein